MAFWYSLGPAYFFALALMCASSTILYVVRASCSPTGKTLRQYSEQERESLRSRSQRDGL